MSLQPGPAVDAGAVTFRFADADRRLLAVDLVQEVGQPRTGPAFTPVCGGWETRFPQPEVDRFEYMLELTHPDGGSELVLDPANPRRAPGAFGDKSVVEFPDYRPPQWLAKVDDVAPGTTRELELDSQILGCSLPLRVWTSAGAQPTDPLPLLVAHDGFEYDEFGGLLDFLRVLTAEGALPPMRAALVQPVGRDDQYSASVSYADAVARELLPFLHASAPVAPGRRMRVGMGASLGALSLLHVHRTHPATFGGLLLQSGSFFHQRYFREQLGFEHFSRIRCFMDRVFAERTWDAAVPVAVTCGLVEMNFRNNRATSLVLAQQGYDVDFRPVRDAHNWIGWRDAWTPSLEQLLRRLWS
jgi:enterochelin esterase-like enzyme